MTSKRDHVVTIYCFQKLLLVLVLTQGGLQCFSKVIISSRFNSGRSPMFFKSYY
jgi:hypothetical protein